MDTLNKKTINVFAKSDYVKAVLLMNYKNQEITYVETPEDCDIEVYEKNTLLVSGKEDDGLLRLKFKCNDESYAKPAYFNEQDLSAFVHMFWDWECNSEEHLVGETKDFKYGVSGTMLDHTKYTISNDHDEEQLAVLKSKMKEKELFGEGIIVTNINNLVKLNKYAAIIQECYEHVQFLLFAFAVEGQEEYIEAFVFE